MRNAGASGTRFDKKLARYLPFILLAVLAGSVVVGLRARKKPSTRAGTDSTAASAATPAILSPSEAAKNSIYRTVTDSSLGDIRLGMTLAEMSASVGPLVDTTHLKKACDYVSLLNPNVLPQGVSLMVVKGKISRIEIENAAIRTENGAGIGDSEDAVRKIYGQGVIIEPHHYMDGHYLEAQSKISASRGVVFETDGRKVTTYRVGFWEPVRWVEGCA